MVRTKQYTPEITEPQTDDLLVNFNRCLREFSAFCRHDWHVYYVMHNILCIIIMYYVMHNG